MGKIIPINPGDKIGENQIEYLRPGKIVRRDRYGWFKCPLCGKEFESRICNVRHNKVHSCGCLQKKAISEIGKNNKGKHNQPYKYLENSYIGPFNTLFLKRTHKNVRGEDFGDFKCSFCGNNFNTRIAYVASGHTSSCGCLNSKGEGRIIKILQEENISFEFQKTFEDCIGENNNKFRFDFYLKDYNLLLEYDGEQHFLENARNKGIFTFDKVKKIIERDKIKEE